MLSCHLFKHSTFTLGQPLLLCLNETAGGGRLVVSSHPGMKTDSITILVQEDEETEEGFHALLAVKVNLTLTSLLEQ
ncbi:hypothetical protein P7K49_031771 [Saguinus oedipus]|uniref:Uncharacterized protein n=1 Tax=Saguinus oedipus TaxID=9490 RepID=A0ABQ9U0C6_SAGOE|nr:hypothetical protein P7K49_031771 [Saguinus oedipus]